MRMKKIISSLVTAALLLGFVNGAGMGTVKTASAEIATVALVPAKVTNLSQVPSAVPCSVVLAGRQGNTQLTTDMVNMIVPVQMDYAGVVELSFTGAGLPANVQAQLYADSGCTQTMGMGVTIQASTRTAAVNYSISSPATYYLKLSWAGTVVPDSSATISIMAYGYEGNELSLTKEYQSVYVGGNNLAPKYHSFTISSDSLVTLYGNEVNTAGAASPLSFSLCDSAKLPVASSTFSYDSTYSLKYALAKGTYYVAVNSGNKYQLKVESKAIADQGKSTKKKATLIKAGKTAKGKVLLSDKTTTEDWFKVKLAKKKNLNLVLNGECTGKATNLKVEIVSSGKQKIAGNMAYLGTGTTTLKTQKKLKKGTYYIRVTKLYDDFSGRYSIKFVK